MDHKTRQNTIISSSVIRLIDKAFARFGTDLGNLFSDDEEMKKMDFSLSDFKKEILLYDNFFSDEERFNLIEDGSSILDGVKKLEDSIDSINDLILKNKAEEDAFLKENTRNRINAEKLRLIESFRDFTHSIREKAPKEPCVINEEEGHSCTIKIKDPLWIKQMEFRGSDDVWQNAEEYKYYSPSKTTRETLISRSQWTSQKTPYDINFGVGVVNCDINGERVHSPTVCEATFLRSSEGDIDVFDSIHELDRLLDDPNLKFGFIKKKLPKDGGGIESTFGLKEFVLSSCAERCAEKKELKSAGFFIVSESFNLYKDSEGPNFEDILLTIPFAELSEMGVQDLALEFISCNTLTISPHAISALMKIAQKYNFKITSHFYNGYLQSNNSYCYIKQSVLAEAQKNTKNPNFLSSQIEAAQGLMDKNLTAPLSKTNSSDSATAEPSPLEKSSAGKRHSSKGGGEERFLQSSAKKEGDGATKNRAGFQLIEVICPGFSNIYVTKREELEDYVTKRDVRTSGHPVRKKLLKPQENIPKGLSFEFEVDCRGLVAVEAAEAGAAVDATQTTEVADAAKRKSPTAIVSTTSAKPAQQPQQKPLP